MSIYMGFTWHFNGIQRNMGIDMRHYEAECIVVDVRSAGVSRGGAHRAHRAHLDELSDLSALQFVL